MIETRRALHARALDNDTEAMRELAFDLLEEFDEEHFDPHRKRHIADAQAVLSGSSVHDFSQPPPQKLSPSARRDHAMHWLREASLRGNVLASAELAELLFRAGAPFHGASLDAFERAATLGDPRSMLLLGRHAWYGCEGAVPDRTRATRWLQRARDALQLAAAEADAFSADALVELGQMHLHGEACAVDVAAAVDAWQQAAALGNSAAMIRLGRVYGDGRAIAFDPERSRLWYERALAAGAASATRELEQLAAICAQRAERDLLRSQAEAGDATAAIRLAYHCETGNDGGDVDEAEAARCYRLAARLGHPTGMLETAKRLAIQTQERPQREAWFWLQLVQRDPWARMKPPVTLLAQHQSTRLAKRLNATQRRAIETHVAAVMAQSKWIDPPME